MTKRQQLGLMFKQLQEFCKQNGIQVIAVAGYENDSGELTSISYARGHSKQIVQMITEEMKINSNLDEFIRTTSVMKY
jgi:hypothetical protein|nr:MAG TPA: hypothetical protein [Caudoviricetes sp.]DAT98814.1 MAG TPA: hypothetical protein [Caudoviricetes sp.]